MRTTLTLEDDVAAMLQKLREERKVGLKEAVNLALREGLVSLNESKPPALPYKTKPVHLGECYFPNLDNIEEILDEVEGPWRK